MANWVIWITCLTEIVFQIPHNALIGALAARRDTCSSGPFMRTAWAAAVEHVHRCLLGDGGRRGLHRRRRFRPQPVRRVASRPRLAHQLERRPLLLLLQAERPTPARALFFVLTALP